MKVSYRVYKDYRLSGDARSDEEILASNAGRRRVQKMRYSFVCMRWHAKSGTLFLGATNSLGDILVGYDVKKEKFRSCGYQRSGFHHRNEHKIHKGLWLDEKTDSIYFGTTTLHDISETYDSRGGTLMRYDIRRKKFVRVANPTPGDFYQGTNYDPVRKMMYMFTMPGACLGVYDIKNKKLVRKDTMESIPHIGCIDDDGGVWGTYSLGRQAFYRYDPDKNTISFPKGCAFPNARESSHVMYMGAGPVDSFLNGGDGYLYVGSCLGELYRIEPKSGDLKYLGKPFAGKRLPGLDMGEDGKLYMCGGSDKLPRVARFDRETEDFEYLGEVKAKDGEVCYRCHELAVVGNTLYVGETDNPKRSGYLWVCEL